MVWHELPRDVDIEPLCENRAEGLGLHLAEPGQRRDSAAEVGSVGRLGPHALGVPAVFLVDHGG